MKFSIQEFGMIIVAYDGEIKDDQARFNRSNLPDWMFRVLGDWMELEIGTGGYVTIKLDDITKEPSILKTYLSIPITLIDLYNNRWMFPIILVDNLSSTEFVNFITAFENVVIKNVTNVDKLALKWNDCSLYLVLNFISLWVQNHMNMKIKQYSFVITRYW